MNIFDIIIQKQNGLTVKLLVKIPKTERQIQRGLMYIKKLIGYDGILLDFGESKFLNMWMKNTLVSLDMLFFNSNCQLMCIHENAVPNDKTSICCESVRYVLEIDGGRTRQLGITFGDFFYL